MRKEILFILFLFGLIFSLGVYAWPTSYPSQLINYQGYYKTNAVNATWQQITIYPGAYWVPTYRNATWISGIYTYCALPGNAAIFAAYGCCSDNTNSSWYQQYGCFNVTTTRYKIQNFGEWECGWNIAYSQVNQTNYTCTDSDGGLNYNVYGTASSTYNGNKNDYCVNTNLLNEAYCSGYISMYSMYGCNSTQICSGGRCMLNQTGNFTG